MGNEKTEPFKHDYDLSSLKLVKPQGREFQMMVTPRYIAHYLENAYEEFSSDLLLNYLQPGTLFIDIGAHYGYYTLLAATNCPNCRIISFEPVPENYEILGRNIDLNRQGHIEKHRLALSDKNEIKDFKITEASDSCSFYEHPLTKVSRVIQVHAVTLDSQTKDIPPVATVVKIDTEGHEISVLRGMNSFFQRVPNVVLLVEFNPCCLRQAGHEPSELLNQIENSGFDIYLIDDKHQWACRFDENIGDWHRYFDNSNLVDFYCNLLCIKKNSPISVGQVMVLRSFEEIHKLIDYARNAKTKLDERQTELDDIQARLIESQKVLEKNQLELNDMQARLIESQKVLEKNQLELNDMQARLIESQKVLEKNQHVLTTIVKSWSWRLTSPMRFVSNFRREITVRRIRLAVGYIRHGDIAILRHGLRSIFRQSESAAVSSDAKPDPDLGSVIALFKKGIPLSLPLTQVVDIIVPVYNGMEYLPNLLESLFRNTDSPYRLILVDDASSDQSVRPYLEKLAQYRPEILLLCSERNLGFVHSVNWGASQVKNHFVILNTDVEVPSGWLQRLMRPITDSVNISSTTPFTNSGSICSFPLSDQDNEIFDGLTVEEVDEVFRAIDPTASPIELPTAVGFCMGINKEVWSHVGSFNDKVFGRGYGEENDWSMRAAAAGYRNMMAPNLFVYHKHGATFEKKEKQALLFENMQRLTRLHPSYVSKVSEFIKRDPADPIRRFALLLLSARQAGKDHITLTIDHHLGGGANIYSQRIIQERLSKGEMILLLNHGDANHLRLTGLYKNYEAAFSLSDLESLQSLVEMIPISEIFYNNLVHFPEPLEVVRIVCSLKTKYGCRLTYALHDFYPLCPSYTLLNNNGKFCNLPDIESCQSCLIDNRHVFERTKDSHDIAEWRSVWQDALRLADSVICFSESSKDLLNKVYSLRPEQIEVRPHEIVTHFTHKPILTNNGPLNIGIIGSIGYQKGSQMVVEIAKLLAKTNPEVKITVIGKMDRDVMLKNFTVTGPYQPDDLPNLIEKYGVNMCLFPSIWPETFSFVCSEIMEMGLPLCCYDLGAQGERVRKYEFGHVIEKISPEATVDEVTQFYVRLKNRSTETR